MEPINWTRVVIFGVVGCIVSAALWAALRGYTGIFNVLNLRVFVGVIILLPALLAPVFGFSSAAMTQNNSEKVVPKSVCALVALFSVVAILAGEFGGSVITGKPIPWEKFNLIFLAVAAVLPFQIPQIFKKK